jgi:hypothetical protein
MNIRIRSSSKAAGGYWSSVVTAFRLTQPMAPPPTSRVCGRLGLPRLAGARAPATAPLRRLPRLLRLRAHPGQSVIGFPSDPPAAPPMRHDDQGGPAAVWAGAWAAAGAVLWAPVRA